MADDTPQRTYKRSWKNLLINKDYQLRMTMVLVGVSALLVAGLGWWVMSQARTATEVATNNVEGTRCERPPWMDAPSRVVVDEITDMDEGGSANDSEVAPDDEGEPPEVKPKEESPTPPSTDESPTPPSTDEPKGEGAPTPDGEGAADGERARPQVTITSSDMELQTAGGDAKAALAQVNAAERDEQEKRYHECQMAKRAKIEQLHDGEKLIMRVLVGLGVLLIVGLAAYGIKMTHRVAGPLFKVSLYLNKLRDNRYDTVYNLRKGDHLVDFYEHFKAAHVGVTALQKEDIARLKAILEAADEADLESKSPELKAAIGELRDLLKERESSIV